MENIGKRKVWKNKKSLEENREIAKNKK